jgi:hypothetical protein
MHKLENIGLVIPRGQRRGFVWRLLSSKKAITPQRINT